MAGIGGYPPVINLQRDERWGELGEGLGKFAGSLFDAWNTADATQKASKILGPDGLPDLDKQMVYLHSRLGDKGDKFIESRMKLQEMRQSIEASKASVRRSEAEIASAKIADQLATLKLGEEPRRFQSEMDTQAAERMSARARAAGVPSEIALRTTEIAEKRQKMEREKQEDELTSKLMQGALDTLARRRAPPAAQGGPTLPATPQSYTVPGAGGGEGGEGAGTIQAPVRRIAAGDVVVPGAPGASTTGAPQGAVDESGKPAETGTFSPQRVFQVAHQAAAGTPMMTEKPPVPDDVIMEAVGHLKNRDIAGYYKTLNDAGIGKDIKEMPVAGAPGYFIAMAMYPDGQMHPVPGAAPIAKLDKTPDMDTKAANGVLQVYQFLDRLKDLGTSGEDGKDPLGGRAARQWADLMYSFGWVSDKQAADYITTTLQTRLGVDTLAAGLRETDKFRSLLDRMTPAVTDSEALRQSKLQALEMFADYSIKVRVENLMVNGQARPPELEKAYIQRGLQHAERNDIETRMRAAAATARQIETSSKGKKAPAAPGMDLGDGYMLTPVTP